MEMVRSIIFLILVPSSVCGRANTSRAIKSVHKSQSSSKRSKWFLIGTTIPSRRLSSRWSLHITTLSMNLNSAIVSFPNVCTSTLFNAVVKKTNAQAAIFQFCRTESNFSVAVVPNLRLGIFSNINFQQKIVLTLLTVVVVPSLATGAAEGGGLGKTFIAKIWKCDAIVRAVGRFEDDDVIHASPSVDTVHSIEEINLELGLVDSSQDNPKRRSLMEKVASKLQKTLTIQAHWRN